MFKLFSVLIYDILPYKTVIVGVIDFVDIRDISVPFPSSREATVAYNSLRVDKEIGRSGVTRSMSVDGNNLNMYVN